MGFQHGDGNEKLLTCQICDAPFEIDANFCTECSASRIEALGGKVARTAKQPEQTSRPEPSATSLDAKLESIVESEPITPPKPKREPRLRPALYNFFSSTGSFFRKRSKLVYAITGALTVFGSYFIVQTLIFMSSTPDEFAQKYAKAVASRDISLIGKDSEIFPNPQDLPVLPAEYQSWRETEGLSWRVSSQWNGWFGKGEMTLIPVDGNSQKYEQSFTTPIRAKYKSKFGIFRDIEWKVADQIASVDIKFGSGKNIGIVLNRVPAGSVGSSSIKETKYAVLPGSLDFQLQGAGFTKPRESKLQIGATGTQAVSFPAVEYELGSARESDAKSQMVDRLITCLKRKCSSLPSLTDYDFDFSNQPDSYMYTDYFIIKWGDDPTCNVVSSTATNADNGFVRLSCSVYASASVKWMLYRILFTTYYDLGYDSKEFTLDVSADISRTSSPYRVSISNFSISS